MPQIQDSTVPADGRARQVLLAEDSATVALLARTLLERRGFVVRLVDGDKQALPALAQESYDFAAVDTAVHGAAAIAAACADRAIPVLAIVSDGGALAGAAVKVATPINAFAFQAAVQLCLDRYKVQSMAAAGIDTHAIVELWGTVDSPGFLRVAGVFVGELQSRLALIPALLAGADRAGLELQAHSIKGAASNVGADAIYAAALKLEAQSLSGGTDELAALVADLQAAAAPGIACLQALILAGQD